MWIFRMARACRATGLAGLLAFGMSADLRAAAWQPVEATAAEPFGLPAISAADGQVGDKWRGVARELESEKLAMALCEEYRSHCTAPAQKFLGIVADGRARDGRARLGEINRALNLAVRPGDDLALYGAADVWRTPLALLATGAGDCEDYAIAKFVALRAAGVAAQDLRLVILRDTLRHEDHAVAAARLDGRWWILDNRRMAMVEDVQLPHVRPLFVMDHAGVRQYVDAPWLAEAPRPAAELMRLASAP